MQELHTQKKNLFIHLTRSHFSLIAKSCVTLGIPSLFERNQVGDRCLVYYEDTCTKTNDGGLKHMHKERKIVWIFPSKENVNRCTVRLVDKYLGPCPPKTTKSNFYLRSLDKPNPGQWYANQVLGQNKKKLLKIYSKMVS